MLLAIVGTVGLPPARGGRRLRLNGSEQYELFRQQVEKDKKKHSSAAANEGKTWQKYIP